MTISKSMKVTIGILFISLFSCLLYSQTTGSIAKLSAILEEANCPLTQKQIEELSDIPQILTYALDHIFEASSPSVSEILISIQRVLNEEQNGVLKELTKRTSVKTLLKRGHLIDPANNINGIMDILIEDGIIRRVEKNIPNSAVDGSIDEKGAVRIIDLSGYYVTPGLIDLHAHVYQKTVPESIIPDHHCFNSGVTTVVDAGSSGANTFEDFKKTVIDISNVRILAFLNIAASGMIADQNPEEFIVPLAVETAKKYPDIIVGFKSAHYHGGNYEGKNKPWASVDAIQEAGRLADLPTMHDFRERPAIAGYPPRLYTDLILKKLRPGDIHTHFLSPQFPVILENGKVNPAMIEAQKRGVIFDVGHGQGSFVFRYAVPSVKQGFLPNSISTDLYSRPVIGSAQSMANIMSKFLCIGVSLEDVIRRSTVNPAREIKHPELGNLSIGSIADIAVFELLEGEFHYTDCSPGQDITGGGKIKGDKKLQCAMTISGGEVVYDPTGFSYRYWDEIPRDEDYWIINVYDPVHEKGRMMW